MLESYVKTVGGRPRLFISGESVSPMAYTTYFEERSCYRDFIKAGYRIFFVNVSFSALPINPVTEFTPFNVGVFEDPDHPDYSELDDAARKIVKECESAVIFPRVYVSMPKRWVDEHPQDVVHTPSGCRESLFSEAFIKDGRDMLLKLVEHVRSSDYSSRIGGWQLCGGYTQEWFHFDLSGSLTESAKGPFSAWVEKTYGDGIDALPTVGDYNYSEGKYQDNESARRYSLFSNLAVANTLNKLAAALKEATEYKQVVGAFYGYATQTNGTPLFGTHGLRSLLDSPNLDFFSAPNAYSQNRSFGIDWADMIPVDSLKLHGKLAFIECDIRTYLTSGVQEARPGRYPEHIYRLDNGKSVWAGPPTEELSKFALRKCFAHQLTRGSGIWWFDMWGGWYDDSMLMDELAWMKDIGERDAESNSCNARSEIVFFADESGYANMLMNSPEINGVEHTRTAMGNIGAPYDTYLVEDAASVIKGYKAAIFPCPTPSDGAKDAMKLCDEIGIPYIRADRSKLTLSADEIRDFIKSSGVHLYNDSGDVVYAGEGYIALHSQAEGEKTLVLPRTVKISAMLNKDGIKVENGNIVRFSLKKNDTAIFRVTE